MSALLEADLTWDGSPVPLRARFVDSRHRRGVALSFPCPACGAGTLLWLRNPLDGQDAPDGILDGVLVPYALFTRVGRDAATVTVAEEFSMCEHPEPVRVVRGRIERA